MSQRSGNYPVGPLREALGELPLCGWAGLLVLVGFLFTAVGAEPDASTRRVLELDGKTGYVELPPNIFNDLKEGTVEVWAKWDRLEPGNCRVFNYGGAMHDVSIAVFPPARIWFVIGDRDLGLQSLPVAGMLRINEWNHVA